MMTLSVASPAPDDETGLLSGSDSPEMQSKVLARTTSWWCPATMVVLVGASFAIAVLSGALFVPTAKHPVAIAKQATTITLASMKTCGKVYSQCGGEVGIVPWTGPTCCESGAKCKKTNEHYSQCVPSTSQSTPQPTPAPSKESQPTPAPSPKESQLSSHAQSKEHKTAVAENSVASSCPPKWLQSGPGVGTRYWDCCKPHCAGENGDCFHSGYCHGVVNNPVQGCLANGSKAPQSLQLMNSNSGCAKAQCDISKGDDCVYTCTDQAPQAINSTHAIALVVAPLYLGMRSSSWNKCYSSFKEWIREECKGDTGPGASSNPDGCMHPSKMESGGECCNCFEFTLDGNSMDNVNARANLHGKKLLAQVTNIGYDVTDEGHFDIMIPGGGFGIFTACEEMTGVKNTEKQAYGETWYAWGARSGGIVSECDRLIERHVADPFTKFKARTRAIKCPQSKLAKGGKKWKKKSCGLYQKNMKTCLKHRCEYLFGGKAGPKHAHLLAGCKWHADWFEAADNPTFTWKRVACPDALSAKSGCKRCSYDTEDDPAKSTCACGESDLCTARNAYCIASRDGIDLTAIEAGMCTWNGCDKSGNKPKPDHCSWSSAVCKSCGGKWCPGDDGHPKFPNNHTCESGRVLVPKLGSGTKLSK